MSSKTISKIEDITCKEVIEQVCENLGEMPDSPLCIAIRDHLHSCSNCTNFYDSLEKTILLYRKYSPELPEGAHERLMKALADSLGDK